MWADIGEVVIGMARLELRAPWPDRDCIGCGKRMRQVSHGNFVCNWPHDIYWRHDLAGEQGLVSR